MNATTVVSSQVPSRVEVAARRYVHHVNWCPAQIAKGRPCDTCNRLFWALEAACTVTDTAYRCRDHFCPCHQAEEPTV